jgi:hypothetical protein
MPITRRRSVRASVNPQSSVPTQEVTAPPSVEEPTTETMRPGTHPAVRTPAQDQQQPKRAKLGWQIRADLIKQCKQLALDMNLHDYEALEMLLEESLARRRGQKEI